MVYLEPGKVMKASNLTVDFVRSMVPRTDNVLLVVVDNVGDLVESLIHGGGVKSDPTATAFWRKYNPHIVEGTENTMKKIVNNNKITCSCFFCCKHNDFIL
jgi:hypothetical protein